MGGAEKIVGLNVFRQFFQQALAAGDDLRILATLPVQLAQQVQGLTAALWIRGGAIDDPAPVLLGRL